MPDTKPSRFTVLRDALGNRVDPNAANFLELMFEDFVMEFPYARPGMQPRVEGRAAVAAYLSTVGDGIAYNSVIRSSHGRVVHWKDYWNPIEELKARLGAAAVEEFLRSEPPDTEQQDGATP